MAVSVGSDTVVAVGEGSAVGQPGLGLALGDMDGAGGGGDVLSLGGVVLGLDGVVGVRDGADEAVGVSAVDTGMVGVGVSAVNAGGVEEGGVGLGLSLALAEDSVSGVSTVEGAGHGDTAVAVSTVGQPGLGL